MPIKSSTSEMEWINNLLINRLDALSLRNQALYHRNIERFIWLIVSLLHQPVNSLDHILKSFIQVLLWSGKFVVQFALAVESLIHFEIVEDNERNDRLVFAGLGNFFLEKAVRPSENCFG